MGTFLAVTVAAGSRARSSRWMGTAFDIAADCERLMSRHDPSSELSRLNARAGQRPGITSPRLARILRIACRLSEQTAGAFDPTIGAMLRISRRTAGRGPRLSPQAVRTAVASIGHRGIALSGPRVALTRSGTIVDLGAIGKGLALDRIVTALRRDGCRAAVVNFGESSLAAIGRSPVGPWRVLLRHPLGGFTGELTLEGLACSTSSTHARALDERGDRHIVDPRTGRPLRSLAQVTVLARSATIAEALSTAFLVLGRDAVPAIARRFGVEACWIDRSGCFPTRGFPLA